MLRRALTATFAVAAATALCVAAVAPVAGAQKQKPLRVLVTNDDGFAAAGIDALVEGLRELPGVKVTVIAPSENKSGTGSTTTPGELVVTETETASGYPAIAVAGFPADTVVYALEQGGVKKRPHLVISGINSTQNVGLAVGLSGTVGAAKAAAARGVSALAVSQGVAGEAEPDYEAGVEQALDWVRGHRKALTKQQGAEVVLDNLNVPTCTTGELRGLVDVPVAPDDVPGIVDPQDCESTLTDPPNDVVALLNGYVTLTELPVPTT